MYARFYDFLEKREGRWDLVLRQPIYEKDRMDPVDPAVQLELNREQLERFPRAIAPRLICRASSATR